MIAEPLRQARIIGALIMREVVTRYGREGLGFLWIVAEPLMFCLGVIVLWSIVRPEYEHGVRVGAFTMTGYMSLLLLRHLINHSLGAIQANIGLLHHRQVKVLHVYLSRAILEVAGTTAAFIVVYAILMMLGQVELPKDLLLLYWGWISLAWLASGLAIVLSALAIRFETVERIVPLFTYLLIPLSGAFFMVSVVPAAYRDTFLLVPIPHAIEMIRAGVFGEFVQTYYSLWYPATWGTILVGVGLLLVSISLKYVDVE